ncbi:ferredoxin [Nocardia sp. CA2R105]|uniref:ferredoxin n=1 Tax=Nocardia coffeae TaxID=2873381 RepID=UPI001CA64484|nr:ferredoxin [Nocardia coffeae]MBY8862142.1 ferredoxin [Nocardia coffeae]
MKVIVDQDKCVGSGQCVMMSEAVFDQRDEDGVVVLLQDEPTEDQYEAVRDAARVCPALAIEIAE